MRNGSSDGPDYPHPEDGYAASHGPTWRVPRQPRGMDAGTRKLAMIAGGFGGALLLAIGVYSMTGHRSGVVPVIQADARPIRIKPENRGGMQVSGADEEIMGGDADASAGKLAPAAEAPAPKMLRAQQDAAPVPAPVPIPAPPPAPRAAAQPEAAPPAKDAAAAAGVEKPAAARAPAAPQPAAGKTQVQLAALGSEEAARTEWHRLAKSMPDLFGNRQPAVSKTEHDGRVLWRLRTGGFADIAQATSFCEKLRAKRAGCSIASF